jgi:hypothetical protein
MTECPHCGAGLPAVVDAFCPECREPLDERSASLATLVERGPEVVTKPPVSTTGVVLMVLGGLSLLTTFVGLFAGVPVGGAPCGVLGIALLVIGASLIRSSYRREAG